MGGRRRRKPSHRLPDVEASLKHPYIAGKDDRSSEIGHGDRAPSRDVDPASTDVGETSNTYQRAPDIKTNPTRPAPSILVAGNVGSSSRVAAELPGGSSQIPATSGGIDVADHPHSTPSITTNPLDAAIEEFHAQFKKPQFANPRVSPDRKTQIPATGESIGDGDTSRLAQHDETHPMEPIPGIEVAGVKNAQFLIARVPPPEENQIPATGESIGDGDTSRRVPLDETHAMEPPPAIEVAGNENAQILISRVSTPKQAPIRRDPAKIGGKGVQIQNQHEKTVQTPPLSSEMAAGDIPAAAAAAAAAGGGGGGGAPKNPEKSQKNFRPPPSFAQVVSSFKADPVLPDLAKNPLPDRDVTFHRGTPAVRLSEAEVSSLGNIGKHVLVGKFSHGQPKLEVIRRFFSVNYVFRGDLTVGWRDSKHVFLMFSDYHDCTKVFLQHTIVFHEAHPMRLFRWTTDFTPEVETSIAPVWILLHGLPLHLFDSHVLSLICKPVGKFLAVDKDTLDRTRPHVARVCVEVDLIAPRVDKFFVGTSTVVGKEDCGFYQTVVYEKFPYYCDHCFKQGHSFEHCKLRTSDSHQNPPKNPTPQTKPQDPKPPPPPPPKPNPKPPQPQNPKPPPPPPPKTNPKPPQSKNQPQPSSPKNNPKPPPPTNPLDLFPPLQSKSTQISKPQNQKPLNPYSKPFNPTNPSTRTLEPQVTIPAPPTQEWQVKTRKGSRPVTSSELEQIETPSDPSPPELAVPIPDVPHVVPPVPVDEDYDASLLPFADDDIDHGTPLICTTNKSPNTIPSNKSWAPPKSSRRSRRRDDSPFERGDPWGDDELGWGMNYPGDEDDEDMWIGHRPNESEDSEGYWAVAPHNYLVHYRRDIDGMGLSPPRENLAERFEPWLAPRPRRRRTGTP